MSKNPHSRQDRHKQLMRSQILDAAHERLVSNGIAGLTMRSLAKDLRLSAPALYRYYPSLSSLTTDLQDRIINDLLKLLSAPLSDSGDSFVSYFQDTFRTLRTWALEHTAEFELVLRSPLTSGSLSASTTSGEKLSRLTEMLLKIYALAWEQAPFSVQLHPALTQQQAEVFLPLAQKLHVDNISPDAWVAFIQVWNRIFSAIVCEVLTAPTNIYKETIFELELAQVAAQLPFNNLKP